MKAKIALQLPSSDMNKKAANPQRIARRDLITMPLALAAGSAVLGGARDAQAAKKSKDVTIDPKYYPLSHFKQEIKLRGKLAVITGASRGIGRAIGEALTALDVDVIGTSRNPDGVANPPDFPLLALDISDPNSVLSFLQELTAHPLFLDHHQVDILINNAGRHVIGQIVPQPAEFLNYLAQRDLGLRTVYFGHVMVTNAVLPLMPIQGYSRIVFTVSISGYLTAALLPVGSFNDVYASAKSALRVYANNLDGALRLGGTNIRVSTVNPYFVNTALLTDPNPIYTQPVGAGGLSDTDPIFNSAITGLRQLVANGLPPSMVGEAYAQLLSMREPDQNIVVASPHGPLAENGANSLIESELIAENLVSAVPFAV